jgi:hypothetical protein
LLKEIGTHFQADAVMAGTLYRWQERLGSDFAVTEPASVAFDLHMVSPADGTILWKGKFDKTQQSLSENLLDWELFRQGKGRWLTAQRLAQIGLKALLERVPQGRESGGEESDL